MTDVSPPTPDELARAIALEAAYEASKPRTPEEVAAVTERIGADWAAEYPDPKNRPPLLDFIRGVVDSRSVTRADRGDVRAFWSWRSQPEGAARDVSHRFLAQACGESRGYQVLEETEAGQKLDSYYLWEPGVQDALVEDYGVPRADMKDFPPEIWKAASLKYAKESTGPAVAFAADIGAGSVLGGIEMPELLVHKNVGKEGVRFPLPLPRHEHLPAAIDELISDEALRCQVRMEDFDAKKTTPAQFAAKLAALDVPEHLKEAHAAAVARLNAAETYPELAAPPAELAEPEVDGPGPTEPAPQQVGADQPGLQEPATAQPDLPDPKAPETEQPAPEAPAPPQPERKVLVHGHSFVVGADLPQVPTRPTRPVQAVAGMHGWTPPAVETAPKSQGIEQ
ncbi:hypothetical protein ACIRBY_11950 [Streptomyces sp. NPDC096136]|uniref:hypothetical protein n=1 Tax=Streptomyces sp. NPDC096136 TaxID=3366076 RepID=UPI00381EAF5C